MLEKENPLLPLTLLLQLQLQLQLRLPLAAVGSFPVDWALPLPPAHIQ